MSVTAAGGWRASGVTAGLKASGRPDIALVVSDHPATVAGAFTTNRFQCAHIAVDLPKVRSGKTRGFVVNAGIANAATGAQGLLDAERMCEVAAAECGVTPDEILVASTGTIGPLLPMGLVEAGIRTAAAELSPDGGADAAAAIMTTDTRPKTSVREVSGGGTVGGMGKGAGMISPQMAVVPHATLLAFVTTDLVAPPELLAEALRDALPTTLNAITIDGSMSPNDTVLLAANGSSGVSANPDEFKAAVREILDDLAYQIVSDGEGASRVVRIQVAGANSDAHARGVARAVADSMLVRSAIWGRDPNWGRIIQQVGQADSDFKMDDAVLHINGVCLAVDGGPTGNEAQAHKTLDGTGEVVISVELGHGDGTGHVLTCDLSPEYVTFNGEYTT